MTAQPWAEEQAREHPGQETGFGMTEFSLQNIIEQVRADLSTDDQHTITDEVFDRIPPGYRETALWMALREMVRAAVTRDHRLRRVRPGDRGTAAANSARSSRVAGIREHWKQLSATYQWVGPGKQLGDYSLNDVLLVAGKLEEQAMATWNKAAQFTWLGKKMLEQQARTVRELPDEVLAQVFTRNEEA